MLIEAPGDPANPTGFHLQRPVLAWVKETKSPPPPQGRQPAPMRGRSCRAKGGIDGLNTQRRSMFCSLGARHADEFSLYEVVIPRQEAEAGSNIRARGRVVTVPGSPRRMGLFLLRRAKICVTLTTSSSRPTTWQPHRDSPKRWSPQASMEEPMRGAFEFAAWDIGCTPCSVWIGCMEGQVPVHAPLLPLSDLAA